VWKIYHVGTVDVFALRGMSLEIDEGDFVAIMGPSGSGKSTAVNMVGCLDIPSKGKIFLDGQDISTLSESDLAQIRGKKIGFIFQQFNLIPTLTALENVTLPMIFQGYSYEERVKVGKDLLTKVGLEERMNHRPTELSGGQQQRVAIARALSNDPQIILADEPTGNLDQKTGREIIDFLMSLHKSGKTIIMVTHDQNLSEYAEKVKMLMDGKVIGTRKGKNFKK
jgi:putative ABC transport system ATP-binding protein